MNRSGNSHVHSWPRKSLVTDTGIPPRATPFYLFSRNHRLFSQQRDKKSDAMNTTTTWTRTRTATRNNAKQHKTTRNNTKQHETTRNNVIATRREGQ